MYTHFTRRIFIVDKNLDLYSIYSTEIKKQLFINFQEMVKIPT